MVLIIESHDPDFRCFLDSNKIRPAPSCQLLKSAAGIAILQLLQYAPEFLYGSPKARPKSLIMPRKSCFIYLILVGFTNSSYVGHVWDRKGSTSIRSAAFVKSNVRSLFPSANLALRGGDHHYGFRYIMICIAEIRRGQLELY